MLFLTIINLNAMNLPYMLFRSQKQLRICVANRLPVLLRGNSIGLVVVDSVGAIFRPDSNIINRAGDMRELAHLLLGLSSRHGCAIVCVNQVSLKKLHFVKGITVNILFLCADLFDGGRLWRQLLKTGFRTSLGEFGMHSHQNPSHQPRLRRSESYWQQCYAIGKQLQLQW